MYDIIIIGSGPAGMTAGMYAARKNLKTLILSKDIGGQTSIPNSMENYPGYDKINGFELMMKFHEQAAKWGSEFEMGTAESIKKNKDETYKIITAEKKTFDTKTIILAFGKEPNRLNIPGEKEYHGKGVSSCVTCDGPLYKNKTIIIIGSGNSAVGGAVEMKNIAKKIYLINRREKLKADPIEIIKLEGLTNLEIINNSQAVEIKGDKFANALVIENKKTKEQKTIETEGIFVEIGYHVNSEFLGDLVKKNEYNEIKTDKSGRTTTPGIFSAGDVTDAEFKQTVIAAGEGAKAALAAYEYLQKQEK